MSDEDLTAILSRTGKRPRARSTIILISVLLVLVGVLIGVTIGVALPS